MNRNDFLRFSASAAFGAAFITTPWHFSGRRTGTGATDAAWPPPDAAEEQFWDFVREQFPLSHERAYLNTGGLGASPYAVIDAVKGKMDELEKTCETGHSEALWEEIKRDAGALLGCDPAEIAFTRNTTAPSAMPSSAATNAAAGSVSSAA